MAKLVVYNDSDPDIGIVLKERPGNLIGSGWGGKCTECAHPIFRWSRDNAVEAAQRHVDSHDI